MATQSPFSLLEDVLHQVGANVQPPAWAALEVQRRLVLLLNHVLMQEEQAMARLARQQGHVLQFVWRQFNFKLSLTPAGLLDLAPEWATADLTLSVTQDSPLALMQSVLGGELPAVRIDGDVQLAGDVNWVVDHVRWDIEDDLSRLLGDAPAHALMQAGRRAMQALRQWRGPSAGGVAR